MARNKEDYELNRQQKLERQTSVAQKRLVKNVIIAVLAIAVIGAAALGLFRYLKNRPVPAESDIISRRGIHWHPTLSITTKGEEQEIQANLGLGVVQQPIHTHDATGVLHLEAQGMVTTDETRLGRFFEIWGKQFNANCIFEFCNGPDGTVRLFVNGAENNEFDRYPMKDKDKIEIRYE